MRFMLPLSLLVFAACGKVGVVDPSAGTGDGAGSFRSTVQTDAPADLITAVESICAGLLGKEALFDQLHRRSGNRFKFSTQTRDCAGAVTASGSAVAQLELSGGFLQYRLVSGSGVLGAVETDQDGLIDQLCERQDDVGVWKQPMMFDTGMAVGYSVSNCSGDPDVRCIRLETGFVTPGASSYQVSRVDDFQLDFSPGQLKGMVTRYRRVDSSDCPAGQGRTEVANFTGLN